MEWAPEQFQILVIVMIIKAAASHRCQFPDFLQSNGASNQPERKWMSHVINDGGSSLCGFHVEFDGSYWHRASSSHHCRGEHIDIGQVAFKRDCVIAVQRNRFVVRHYEVKTDAEWDSAVPKTNGDLSFKGYLCVEFVRRGPTIVQVRTTEKHRWLADSSVCNDNVILDDWPLVDFGASFFSVPTSCRLVIGRGNRVDGGFSVRLYDKALKQGLCDALDGETRVEFACGSDVVGIDDSDNLIDFRFRHSGCVPRGFGMTVNQRVRCIASWTDDSSSNGTAQNSFAVLRHDTDRRAWCFRFPSSITSSEQRSGSFTGHLFRDVRCDRADGRMAQTALKTDRFIRIDFIPDEPIYARSAEQRSSPSAHDDGHDHGAVESIIDGRVLCQDDYEACHFWANQPCRDEANAEKLACPRRCKVCSDERPTACSLPRELRGQWKENQNTRASRDGRGSLAIGRHTAQFFRGNSSVTLSCIEWDATPNVNNSTPSSPSASYERMFVRLFPNGCRPRYACAQFRRPSTNILLVRVSRFRTWPFVAESDSPVQCSKYFSYEDDFVYNHNNQQDGVRGFQLFVSTSMSMAACVAKDVTSVISDVVGYENLRVDFPGSTQCQGHFQMSDENESKLTASGHPVAIGEPVANIEGYRPNINYNGKSDGATTFKLVLSDYPEPGQESEQSYKCIDSSGSQLYSAVMNTRPAKNSSSTRSSLFALDRYMLTETGDDGVVLCWWFPGDSVTTLSTGEVVERFYLLPGVACYDETVSWLRDDKDTNLQSSRVLATFIRVRPIPLSSPEVSPTQDENDSLTATNTLNMIANKPSIGHGNATRMSPLIVAVMNLLLFLGM